MDIRITVKDGEYKWLKELVKKAKYEAHRANIETPHPLLELRRDNMVALEKKLNQAMQKKIQER